MNQSTWFQDILYNYSKWHYLVFVCRIDAKFNEMDQKIQNTDFLKYALLAILQKYKNNSTEER
jgi:hypothetical protein